LNNPSGLIDVLQAAWLGTGQVKTIPARKFAAKVLCQRHNEVLSGLDNLAYKFFAFLVQLMPEKDVLLLNGTEIERWMLKLLCGLWASSGVEHWEPPKQWLDILFNSGSMPEGCGLHYVKGKYRARVRRREVIALRSADTGLPVGVIFTIQGLPFLCAMEALPESLKTSNMNTSYRPKAIQINDDNKLERIVHLGWREGVIVFVDRGRPYAA
jgi:hypothetical protein